MKLFKIVGIAIAGFVTFILGLLISLLGLPLTIFFGWLAGHVLTYFAGGFIVLAITTLLGAFGITATITTSMIPLMTAALAFFGYFFKTPQTKAANSKNSD